MRILATFVAGSMAAPLLSMTASNGSTCHPLQSGELRVFQKRSQCIDIHGTDGSGNIQQNYCDGHSDQYIMRCDDGTIRNEAMDQCFTTESPYGYGGNVYSTNCTYFQGEVLPVQRWDWKFFESFDDAGISQESYVISNHQSESFCLNIEDNGNINTAYCSGGDDQLFYFRNRGKVVKSGVLFNGHNWLCLDKMSNNQINGTECNRADINQLWTLYENGEFVNSASRECLDVEGSDGHGLVRNDFCTDQLDQMWTPQCHDDYCYYINKADPSYCLDANAPGKQAYSNVCNWTQWQQFTVIAEPNP